MKKYNLNIIAWLSVVASGLLSGYFFMVLWDAARHSQGIGAESAFFGFTLIIGLIIFGITIYLGWKQKINRSIPALFIPAFIASFIFLIWMVVSTPYVKEYRLELDNNPLLYGGDSNEITGLSHGAFIEDGERVGRRAFVMIYEPYFWMDKDLIEIRLTEIYNQKEKNSRLIKFSDPVAFEEIEGYDESVVIAAFGEPISKTTAGDYEIWIYNPWQHHPNWEMSVYLHDGKLVNIGDL